MIQDGIEKISGLNVLDSLIKDVHYAHTKINASVQGKSITSKGMGNKVNNLKIKLDELNEEKQEKETDHHNKDKLLDDTIE